MRFVTIAVIAATTFFGTTPTPVADIPAALTSPVAVSGQGGILANI